MKRWMMMGCALLSACATTGSEFGNPGQTATTPQGQRPAAASADVLSPEQRRLIDAREVVAQSQMRVADSVVGAPKLSDSNDAHLRDGARVQIAEDVPKVYLDVGEPKNVFNVSLSFNNVNMLSVAQMLSEITDVNILVGDEVQKSLVTAKLVNVPWDKGLDAILKTKGLAKHVDTRSNIIRIHDQATLVSLEDFDRKRAEDLKAKLELKRAVEPQYTEIFRLFYADPEVVKAEIVSVLKGSEKDAAKTSDKRLAEVTVDKRVNSLIIKGSRQELELVHNLVAKLDVRTRQVLIEAFIVEATDDFNRELGARLSVNRDGTRSAGAQLPALSPIGATTADGAPLAGLLTDFTSAAASGGVGVLLKTSTQALRAELFAMEQSGLSKVLSNPKIFTLDREDSSVEQAVEIAYPGTADKNGNSTVQFKKAKLSLNVNPLVVGDGNVSLKVTVIKETPDWSKASATGVPPIDGRTLVTKLLVPDGSIAVIGGVFNQEESNSASKIPGLGDIPVLGRLFRKDVKKNGRKELLIFLAPRVL